MPAVQRSGVCVDICVCEDKPACFDVGYDTGALLACCQKTPVKTNHPQDAVQPPDHSLVDLVRV